MNHSSTHAIKCEYLNDVFQSSNRKKERRFTGSHAHKNFTSDSLVQRMRFFSGRSYLALSGARDGAGARPVDQRIHGLGIGMVVA